MTAVVPVVDILDIRNTDSLTFRIANLRTGQYFEIGS